MKKEILKKAIITVLRKYGDKQANLGSESCRQNITKEVVKILTKELPILKDVKL